MGIWHALICVTFSASLSNLLPCSLTFLTREMSARQLFLFFTDPPTVRILEISRRHKGFSLVDVHLWLCWACQNSASTGIETKLCIHYPNRSQQGVLQHPMWGLGSSWILKTKLERALRSNCRYIVTLFLWSTNAPLVRGLVCESFDITESVHSSREISLGRPLHPPWAIASQTRCWK